ncbi:TIR domain-containing protein [Nannocystaceae bacterium ST9]
MLPLLVHLLHHPRSEPARSLALGLHHELTSDPAVPGLRVPIVFTPDEGSGHPPLVDELGFGEATRNFVVLIADDTMVVELGEPPPGRTSWARFAGDLFESMAGDPRCLLLPVQASPAAWPLDARLESINFERAHLHESGEPRVKWLARRVVIQLCRFLAGEQPGDDAPIQLFVSHAKADLGGPEDVVGKLLEHLDRTQPISTWVDSAKIPAGSDFGQRIEAGVTNSSVLAVLTDNYSSRPWCRREILIAKREQRPLVVVDALAKLELRAFPYLGNVPVRRWTGHPDECVDLLMRESLRLELTRLELGGDPRDQVLTSRPELATLLALDRTRPILYPDPPLGDEELELLARLDPTKGLDLSTPLLRVARDRRLQGVRIALSAGESRDLARRGLIADHLQTAMLDLCCQLLTRGASLAYGGHLDPRGYTLALLDLALTHQAIGLPAIERIECYLAWSRAPMAPAMLAKLAQHQRAATWKLVPRPAGIEDLDPVRFGEALSEPLAPCSAIDRYAIARSMTSMREQQTADIDARVVMGGKLDDYTGRMPGVLEEVLLTMQADKPTFVIGAFGGAAGMIADVLAGHDRVEMTWAHHRGAPHLVEMRELYERREGSFLDYPEMLAFLRERGPAGLNNGLSDEQNRELWRTRELGRIVALVLEGLTRVRGSDS